MPRGFPPREDKDTFVNRRRSEADPLPATTTNVDRQVRDATYNDTGQTFLPSMFYDVAPHQPRPTYRLPYELVREVLLTWCAVEATEEQGYLSKSQINSVPFNASAVSHSWRVVALGTPILWTDVVIHMNDAQQRPQAWTLYLRCLRERSAALPDTLKLHTADSDDAALHAELAQLFLKSRALRIFVRGEDAEIPSYLKRPGFLILAALSVLSDTMQYKFPFKGTLTSLAVDALLLGAMELWNAFLPWDDKAVFPNVSHLRWLTGLRLSVEHLVTVLVLGRLPGLEILTLRAQDDLSPLLAADPIMSPTNVTSTACCAKLHTLNLRVGASNLPAVVALSFPHLRGACLIFHHRPRANVCAFLHSLPNPDLLVRLELAWLYLEARTPPAAQSAGPHAPGLSSPQALSRERRFLRRHGRGAHVPALGHAPGQDPVPIDQPCGCGEIRWLDAPSSRSRTSRRCVCVPAFAACRCAGE